MIQLAGGWGWRRVYRKNNTTIGCAACCLKLAARRCAPRAHTTCGCILFYNLKWSSLWLLCCRNI